MTPETIFLNDTNQNKSKHTMISRHTSILVFLFFIHIQPFFARDSPWFSQVLPSGAVECFYEVLDENIPVRVSTVVMDGGRRDIRVLVRHTSQESQIAAVEPRNVKVKTFRDTTTRQHLDFKTDIAGEYSFCFDNRLLPPTTGFNLHAVPSDLLDVKDPLSKADKFVAFELHFHETASEAQLSGNAPKREQAHLTDAKDKSPADLIQHKGINDLITQIRDKLDDVASESNYYHFREEQNRNTAEVGNTRVAWLTLCETLVLLVVTACEIFLVRSWFKENSKRARSWA